LPRSRANAAAAWREPRASAHAGLEAVLSEVGGTTLVPPHPAAPGARARWSRPAPRPAP
jgi:hypothetical protein